MAKIYVNISENETKFYNKTPHQIKLLRRVQERLNRKTKICGKCKIEFPISCFHNTTKYINRLKIQIKDTSSWCKECSKARANERYSSELKIREKVKYRTKKNRPKVIYWDLKKKYNLDREQYEELLRSQHYKCGLCYKEFSNNKNINIDHSHITGNIRGILCSLCNMQLGTFEKLKNKVGIDAIYSWIDRGRKIKLYANGKSS